MMEKLQTTTVHLLRYGGLYPFKKTNRSNHPRLSVWLALWTVFLNLMAALSCIHVMRQSVMFSSLQTFLDPFLLKNTWSLASFLIPLHFVFHARKITALNIKLDNIIAICSIHSSKFFVANKLKIILLIFVKIINLFNSTSYLVIDGYFDSQITNMKLSTIIVEYHVVLIEIIITFMFAMHLTIMAGYLQLCNTRLELFDGMISFTRQISELATEEDDEISTRLGLHPFGLHSSSIAEVTTEEHDEASTRLGLQHPFAPHSSSFVEEAAYSIGTTNTLFFSAQLSEPSQLFTELKLSQLKKSLQTRVNTVGTQTRDLDENTAVFFQKLEVIHASIFEAYDTYQLYICVLGFPILYFTFVTGAGFLASAYRITELDLEYSYPIVTYVSIFITNLMNFALLTAFPQTVDQKVCNAAGKILTEVTHSVFKNQCGSANTEHEYFFNIHCT